MLLPASPIAMRQHPTAYALLLRSCCCSCRGFCSLLLYQLCLHCSPLPLLRTHLEVVLCSRHHHLTSWLNSKGHKLHSTGSSQRAKIPARQGPHTNTVSSRHTGEPLKPTAPANNRRCHQQASLLAILMTPSLQMQAPDFPLQASTPQSHQRPSCCPAESCVLCTSPVAQ
jgi:hypothetical protein